MTVIERTSVEEFIWRHKLRVAKIAENAGVSRPTVYTYMKAPDTDVVSPETRERIMAAILAVALDAGIKATEKDVISNARDFPR